MTEKQLGKALTWTELQKMESSFTAESRGHALYSLYSKIPPRRGKDYRLMKLGNKNDSLGDDNFNYIDLQAKPPQFIFNVFKTVTRKGYGQYIATIPDELAVVLKKYIDEYSIRDGDFLFYNKTKDQPYTSSTFSSIISGIFKARSGIKIDMNALRHAYASHILSPSGSNFQRAKLEALSSNVRMSMNDLENIAKSMGTSAIELLNTYNKLDLE